jgi:hypothetical protein
MPPEHRDQMRPVAESCVAIADCKARVACWQPALDQIMAGRKAAGK